MRTRLVLIGGILGMLSVLQACGGGEEATPTRAPATPAPTATRAAATPTTTAPAAQTVTPATPTRAAPTPPATVASTPSPAGTLRVAMSSLGQENLDPIGVSYAEFTIFGGPLYDWLTWADEKGALSPGVAERWTMAPDGKTWTFHLRAMKFHNGADVTADDAKAGLERVLTVSDARSTNVAILRRNVDAIAASDPRTLVVRMKNAFPDFGYIAGPRQGSESVLVPKAVLEQQGASAFFSNPIGTGPWKFASRQQGVYIRYERSPVSHPYRQAPKFQSLELVLAPEESTRLAMLRTGGAELAEVSTESLAVMKQAGLKLLKLDDAGMVSLVFYGMSDPDAFSKFPTSKREVRQALLMATNRQEINDTLLSGLGKVPARTAVGSGTEGYDPSWQPYPYDPARAKQLLAQAGYPNGGFAVKFYNALYQGFPWMQRAGEAVAGYWNAVGVRAELQPVDASVMRQLSRQRPQTEVTGKVQIIGFPIPPTPFQFFSAIYPAGGVILSLPTKEMNDLVGALGKAIDPAERTRLIREIANLEFNEVVYPGLIISPTLYGASSKVAGWKPIGALTSAGPFLETVEPAR